MLGQWNENICNGMAGRRIVTNRDGNAVKGIAEEWLGRAERWHGMRCIVRKAEQWIGAWMVSYGKAGNSYEKQGNSQASKSYGNETK